MTVINVWVGSVTPTTARVIGKTDGASIRLAVSDNAALIGPVFFGPVIPTAQDITSLTATGLDPDSRYWYQLEEDSVLDTVFTGQFRTHPPLGSPATFTIAASSCAGLSPDFPGDGTELRPDRISNHPVFETIRARAMAEDWLGFVHLGDMHYYNLGSTFAADLTNYRRGIDDVLHQTNQHRLYREVATVYVWDDHDYGPNDSDSTSPGRANAQQVYRERVPSYPLPASGPIYHSFEIGRVLFIASDTRSERTPNSEPDGPSKTMLGAAQKTWMAGVLAGSEAKFLCWFTPSPWVTGVGVGSDTWSGFATETAELVDMFTTTGWIDRMCAVTGDTHYLGIDTGTGVSPGGIPLFAFGSADSPGGSGSSLPWDTGPVSPGPGRYGTIAINDTGSKLTVTGSGFIGSSLWRSHTLILTEPTPLGLDVGDRVTVANMPDWVSRDEVSQLAQGFTERLSNFLWFIEVNASPESPYRVGVYAEDDAVVPVDAPSRYSSAGTVTTADFDAGTDTALAVGTLIRPYWTTDSANMPFDILVSGVRLRVTAISAPAGDFQTMTVQQVPINGVVKTVPAATVVALFQPAVYAL